MAAEQLYTGLAAGCVLVRLAWDCLLLWEGLSECAHHINLSPTHVA